MSKSILNQKQIDAFHEQGFVRIDGLFDDQEMQQLERACDQVYDKARKLVESGTADADRNTVVSDGARFSFQSGGDGMAVRHVAWCGQAEPIFDRFGQDEKLLRIVGELLGCDEVSQLINQVHYKKPGTGVKFDWHQDSEHRGIHTGQFEDVLGNGSYVQIAVAIDDVEADSGPLGFIPRSNQHKFLGKLYNDQGEFCCDKVDESDEVYPLLKRGDAVAFGSYTIHGSRANTGKSARRTFINGFAAPGADKKKPSLPGEGRILKIPGFASVS